MPGSAAVVAAGPLYTLLGPRAFFLNALIYAGSFAIYRFGVTDPRSDHQRDQPQSFGIAPLSGC